MEPIYPNENVRRVTLLVERIALWMTLVALLLGSGSFAGVETLLLSKGMDNPPANPDEIRVLSLIALISGIFAIGLIHAIRYVVLRRVIRRGSWAVLAIAYPIGKIVTWTVCDGVVFFSLVIVLMAQSFWPSGPIAAGAWLVMAADIPMFLPFRRLKTA